MMRRVLITFILLLLLLMVAMKISHAGAGSFTIKGTATQSTSKIQGSTCASTRPDSVWRWTRLYVGKSATAGTYRAFIKFTTLRDTIRALGTTHQIDSAKYMVVAYDVGSSTDSVFVSMFPITQNWGTTSAAAADTCGVSWDSAFTAGDGACSYTSTAWSTAGGTYSATAEHVAGHSDSVLFTAGVADKYDSLYFWITGASITTDTINQYGFAAVAVGYGGDDGTQARWNFAQYYNTLEPVLTVWYSDKPAAGGASKRRRIVLGRPQ
jgi:hypothetical protein